jgi:hypothetical protein
MEEEYEAIDKIINRVMARYGNIGHVNMLELLREVTIAALEEGHKAGCDNGYEEGLQNISPEQYELIMEKVQVKIDEAFLAGYEAGLDAAYITNQ